VDRAHRREPGRQSSQRRGRCRLRQVEARQRAGRSNDAGAPEETYPSHSLGPVLETEQAAADGGAEADGAEAAAGSTVPGDADVRHIEPEPKWVWVGRPRWKVVPEQGERGRQRMNGRATVRNG
jgi:hypothetical protein